MNSPHVRNIGLDLLFTLLTCGLYNIYVQYRQILALNEMLKEERYSFLNWLIFVVLTCGLYHIYHEYRTSEDLCRLLNLQDSKEPIIAVILTVFGMHIVCDAIQQYHINRFYGVTKL